MDIPEQDESNLPKTLGETHRLAGRLTPPDSAPPLDQLKYWNACVWLYERIAGIDKRKRREALKYADQARDEYEALEGILRGQGLIS